MHLHITSPSPVVSARALDDGRLVLQIMEAGLALTTVLRHRGCRHPAFPTPAQWNDPAVLWAGASSGNWSWVHRYFARLCAEKKFRWPDKPHHAYWAAFGEGLHYLATQYIEGMTMSLLQPFPKALGLQGYAATEVNRAHLRELWRKDKRPPRWTRRGPPGWCGEISDQLELAI